MCRVRTQQPSGARPDTPPTHPSPPAVRLHMHAPRPLPLAPSDPGSTATAACPLHAAHGPAPRPARPPAHPHRAALLGARAAPTDRRAEGSRRLPRVAGGVAICAPCAASARDATATLPGSRSDLPVKARPVSAARTRSSWAQDVAAREKACAFSKYVCV